MRLKGQIALITGAGSGIGRATAQIFAREGASVIACGRRSDALEESLASLEGGHAAHLSVPADISDSAAVAHMFDVIDSRFDRIDVLVNNAGIGVGEFERYNRTMEARGKELASGQGISTRWRCTELMSDETWRMMMRISLDGMFFCTRGALARIPDDGGSIINVSSTAALAGQEGAPHYSTAKAGVLGFTRSLAREVASEKIRVNAICPGFVETPMSEEFSPAIKRGTMGRIPLGRWGQSEEVAATALFLASDESSYFTGQVLSPNGGFHMSQ